MMKRTILAAITLLLAVTLQAQKRVKDGRIPKININAK